MKKSNKEEFITKARKVHGDKYGYSKVEYANNATKVCIVCPEHGEFWQTPHMHLSGCGCPSCKNEKTRQRILMTRESFIGKAKKIHGEKYDYSKVNYVDCETKVCIICPVHGEFWQTPSYHTNGKGGCPKCYDERRGANLRSNKEEFIEKAKQIYGNKYDYSKVNYVNARTKVCIVCPEHGEFYQTPLCHLHSNACPKCSKHERELISLERKREKEKASYINKKRTQEDFILKNAIIHNNKYDYSKVEYKGSNAKVCIICPEHGEFWQMPGNHSKGCGCPECAKEGLKIKNALTAEEFIEKAKAVHGNKYDYSKVNYVNGYTKVCIICPEHGEFWQTPAMHTCEKQGCPFCGHLSSKEENEIYDFIKNFYGGEVITRDKSIIRPKEIDIYIPGKKLAIEYNGLRWHSEIFDKNKYYHLSKTEQCAEKGIRLIHIFEDEWFFKKEIVKNKITHMLNCDSGKPHIYPRKCSITVINKKEADGFLDVYHIQGSTVSSVYLGCYHEGKLIAVMSFLRSKGNRWILNRFASDYNYICCGIGGKLFSYFIKNHNPDEVITFADRRWTLDEKNNLYTKIGFKLDGILPPQYQYVTPNNSYKKRYHKFNFRKKILLRKYPNERLAEDMTENEMVKKLGYYKIWDCGLYKYKWER